MPGLIARPCGGAHSAMGASWPWLESGEPMFDDDAEAVDRFDDGPGMSQSSAYMPGDARPALYMYGASAAAYMAAPSYAIVAT